MRTGPPVFALAALPAFTRPMFFDHAEFALDNLPLLLRARPAQAARAQRMRDGGADDYEGENNQRPEAHE